MFASNSFWEGNPPTSYIYSPGRKKYLFEDKDDSLFSHQVPFKIKGEKVIFTCNNGPVIQYEGTFYRSLDQFMNRIQLLDDSKTIDSKMKTKLEKIKEYLSSHPCGLLSTSDK